MFKPETRGVEGLLNVKATIAVKEALARSILDTLNIYFALYKVKTTFIFLREFLMII